MNEVGRDEDDEERKGDDPDQDPGESRSEDERGNDARQ